MKKRLYLMLLLLLGIGGIVYGAVTLGHAQTQVELYPTILAGDPEAARGLSLHYGVSCDSRLLWETDCAIGKEPESTFTFDRDAVKYLLQKPYKHWGVQPRFDGLSFSSSRVPDGLDDQASGTLDPIILDVAKRTAPGTERREVLRLGDYLESYPLTASIPFYGEYMPLLSITRSDEITDVPKRLSEKFIFLFWKTTTLRWPSAGTVTDSTRIQISAHHFPAPREPFRSSPGRAAPLLRAPTARPARRRPCPSTPSPPPTEITPTRRTSAATKSSGSTLW